MNNFVVSARKYRPKVFDEVVGQGHVSDTLKKALSSEKIGHAYLFCGPRGVGKTTCARILAKVVNCETPIDKHTPCNTCNSCKTFEDNASFNIIELDAASNNSVENIRSLIDQVRIQPQSGKFKIFIIDEVHMLSQAAFNAFLKTLEEPPPYVIFIMATTEKHKILPTILSRCQIYDFKRIQPSDIVIQLNYILDKEGKTADPEALHIIGQKADGAMRDALSIYDRIASSTGNHITYKDVVDNLNLLDYDYFFSVTDNLILERLGDVLLDLDDILHKGFEADQFMHGLSDHFRNLLMLIHPETIQLLDVGESLMKRYQTQSALIRKDTLMSFLNIANECDIKYTTAKNKRLHVEVALSKMTYASRLLQSSEMTFEEKKTKVGNDSLLSNDSISNKSLESNDTSIGSAVKHVSSIEKKEEIIEIKPEVVEFTKLDSKDPEEKSLNQGIESNSPKTTKDTKSVDVETRADLVNNPNSIASIGGFSIPDINSSSFDNVEEQVRQEEIDRDKNLISVSAEVAKEVIDIYAASHSSKSIRQVLAIVIVKYDEDQIQIYVPSVIAMESVTQQDKLMDNLREKFGRTDLAIPVIINPDMFPDYSAPVVTTRLSDKEKYLMMIEKNPLVETLQKRFDLQPS